MNLAGSKAKELETGNLRRVRQRVQDEDKGEMMDGEMEDLRRNMEMMTATVGTGPYAQTILSALSVSSTANARDIANLQAAVTRNYEIPPDSKYITLPKECLKVFGEHCKNRRAEQNIQATPRTTP